MTPGLGDRYGDLFSRAMRRDVDPAERRALASALDDASAELHATHGRRPRNLQHRSLFAQAICEAIDERLHGRET